MIRAILLALPHALITQQAVGNEDADIYSSFIIGVMDAHPVETKWEWLVGLRPGTELVHVP
jgi:hypothetical protein